MQILFTKRLIAPLAENRLTSAQQRNYLILTFIWLAGFPGAGAHTPQQTSQWMGVSETVFGWIIFTSHVLLTVVTMYLAWRANGGADGRHFIERIVVLFVPLGIQTFLLGFLLGLLGSIIAAAVSGGDQTSPVWFWVGITVVVITTIYWYARVIECCARIRRFETRNS